MALSVGTPSHPVRGELFYEYHKLEIMKFTITVSKTESFLYVYILRPNHWLRTWEWCNGSHSISTTLLIHKVKAERKKRPRKRFFKQNHGQLLQQLVCQRADIGERMIITLEDLEKATNNFDKSRELGGGGHGIVYKGISACRRACLRPAANPHRSPQSLLAGLRPAAKL